MRTVASPSCLATGAIWRSNTAPSAGGMTSGAAASGRPAASVGKTSALSVLGVCLLMSGSLRDRFGTNLFDYRRLGTSRRFRACGDSTGKELGIVLDPADEGRAARVLPGKAEEVEAGNVGHTPAVPDAAIGSEDRCRDPGVIGAVAGRPDHGVDFELAAVGEADRATLGADDPRLQADPVATKLARARTDQRVALACPSADPGIDRLVDQARFRQ